MACRVCWLPGKRSTRTRDQPHIRVPYQGRTGLMWGRTDHLREQIINRRAHPYGRRKYVVNLMRLLI
jgi:hypothetical protein